MATAQKLAEQVKNLEEEIQQKENRLLELKQQHKVQAGNPYRTRRYEPCNQSHQSNTATPGTYQ